MKKMMRTRATSPPTMGPEIHARGPPPPPLLLLQVIASGLPEAPESISCQWRDSTGCRCKAYNGTSLPRWSQLTANVRERKSQC
jgi:hypothetical protein